MMPTQSSLFPPLPNDTVRAAEAVPGKGIYLTIGAQIEQLFADIELARLDPSGSRSASTLAVLALVTIFQFAEDLPDRRAAEATRARLDWKYALRLARTYPGLDYRLLCEFRQPLLRDVAAQQTFQQVLDRLAETDLLSRAERRHAETGEVLAAVCGVSRLEQLIEAMRMVLEAVASVEPECLRTITLPHWYERYGQLQAARDLPKSMEEQAALARAIGADATYLLEAIVRTNSHLTSLPEVRALHQIWLEQFDRSDHQIQWRTSACASCFSP
jgi:transposase